jgi:mannose-6-phosphate isomerase-like protein (cupin superfamily)
MAVPQSVTVLDGDSGCPRLPIVRGEGTALAIVWPGMGAQMRSMCRIVLEAASATVQLSHPMEAVYYVIAGTGSVIDASLGETRPVVEGSMIHIEPGTHYSFLAGQSGLEIIGGPCPADAELFRSIY